MRESERLRARLTHTGYMKTSPAKINDLTTIADDAIAALERAEAERDELRRYVAVIWEIVQLDREAATEGQLVDAWLGIYQQAGAAMGDPECRWVLGEEATDGE